MNSPIRAKTETFLLASILLGFASASSAWAADPRIPGRAPVPEKTNVDILKQKYWAQGEESELEVVQNRTYAKAGKFGFGTFVGTVSTDPFLNVKSYGLRAGYYLSEYFGIFGLYWKESVGKSSALQAFEASSNSTTNSNPPRSFKGLHGEIIPIYGKLSVFGKAIIYYDLDTSLGVGQTTTDNGTYLTPYFGIGQKVYLTKHWALSVDYRLMMYNEDIIQKVAAPSAPPVGTFLFSRTNWSDVITAGIDLLF